MKVNLKGLMAGTATLAIAGSGLLVSAGAAHAAQSAPPFEPDTNAAAPYSNIEFFDANGNQVTGGTNLTAPFAYAVALGAPDTNANKGNLYFAQPVPGEGPSGWSSQNEAGPTQFSPASALPAGTPAPVAAYAPTHPLVATPNASITDFSNNFPSQGTITGGTSDGYADTIQVRFTDSGTKGAGTPTGKYWETDIAYNTSSSVVTVDGVTVAPGSWAQVFPFYTATTTSLTTSASGGTLTGGSPITLTATIGGSPADGGTVEFFDGSTPLGSGTTTGGTATYNYTPAPGSHSYTAEFLGDESQPYTANTTNYGESVSSAVPVSVSAAPTSTSVSASSTSIFVGDSDTLTATVTPAVAGTVQFSDNGTALGSPVSVSGGSAQLTTSSLPQGSDQITAVFTPTDTTDYEVSPASAPVTVTVQGVVSTSTALSTSKASITVGDPETLTATVTENNTANPNDTAGLVGSVQFYDTPTGGSQTAIGSPVATTVSGTTGTAQVTTQSLPVTTTGNSDSITAVFTPTNTAHYGGSTSSPVDVTVNPPACPTGSTCNDTQNLQVTVNNGTITIATPYTSSNPFVLPAMQLSPDGTFLYSCGVFPSTSKEGSATPALADCNGTSGNPIPGTAPTGSTSGPQGITVASTLAGNPDWTVSVTATNLTGQNSGKTIPADQLGLTGGNTAYQSANTTQQTIAYTDNPAVNPSPYDPSASGAKGLDPVAPATFAKTTGGGDGTTVMYGDLTLFANTATPADTYTGTITFTVTPANDTNDS